MTRIVDDPGRDGGAIKDRVVNPIDAPQSKLLVILALAMGIAPLTGYAAAALSPTMVADLQITSSQFGMFATVSFFSAAACSLILSRVVGRLSARVQISVIFVGAALTLGMLAFADSLIWIALAAAVSGPSHALSNPFTNRVVAERISADLRSRWMGIKQSGVQCSQAFAGLALPIAAAAFGWRISFLMLSIGALALVFLGRAFFSVLREASRAAKASPSPPPPISRNLVWVFAAYALCSGAGMQATNVYLPLFAREILFFSPVTAGFTVAVAGGVGLCARILWGRKTDLGRKAGSLLFLLALGAIVGVVCLALAGETKSSLWMWTGVVLHGATAIGSNVVVMVGLMGRVPASQAGRASATAAVGMYLGFALGPLMMSGLLALTGSYVSGWCLVAACYMGGAIVAQKLR